jgi:hypothetical protein
VAVYSADYDRPPNGCWLKSKAEAPSFKTGVFACYPKAGPTPAPPPAPPPTPGPTPAPPAPPQCYNATVSEFDEKPVVSFVDGTSKFAQVFNPSWIQATEGTGGKSGLAIRTQNCTGCGVAGENGCCGCSGTGEKASIVTFAELLNNDNTSTPKFKLVDGSSVVFGPHDQSDVRGTEDPRIALDPKTGIFYMLYTCFGDGKPRVTMCMATSKNPTSNTR